MLCSGGTDTRTEMRRESKAIAVLMAHVSIKIDAACLVSGRVSSSIQFPPEVELHRQRLNAGRCACGCVCVYVCIATHSCSHVKTIVKTTRMFTLLSSVKRSCFFLRELSV